MSELASLRSRRGKQRAALTRIRKYVDSLDTEIVSSIVYFEIKTRLEKLHKINEAFEQTQEQIENLLEQDIQQDEEEEYKAEFEGMFYTLCAEMECILQRFTDSASRSSSEGGNNVTETVSADKKRVKLPTIQLPTFDGEYKNWITFRDMFTSLIHEQATLSKIEKFHYLRASLKGEASGLIDSLQISEDNYEVAFSTLIDRYNNKKLLIHHHLKLIFETPVVAKESLLELRRLVDDIKGNISILKNLGIDTSAWDSWVLYLISTKLDSSSRREWEKYISAKEFPSLQDFYEFMNQRCQFLEKLKSERPVHDKKQLNKLSVKTVSPNNKSFSLPVKNFVSSNIQQCCPHCKEEHKLFNCAKFLELPINSRYQRAKQLKVCLNCLRGNHVAKVCIAGGCKNCGMKHNSLLHFDPKVSKGKTGSLNSREASVGPSKEKPLVSASSTNNGQVLLSTALVKIVGRNRQQLTARVLLDSGSQSNFITRECFAKMRIPSRKINQSVTGIGTQKYNVSEILDLEIHSLINKFSFNASFLVIDKITESLPQSKINVRSLQIPDNVALADPGFATPGKIDMLLGASAFWNLLCVGQIKLNGAQTIIQKTRLGWIVSGTIPNSRNTCKYGTTCNLSLEQQLEKCWSIEDGCTKSLKENNSHLETDFNKTLIQRHNSHFEVGLPLKPNAALLGDSYQQAIPEQGKNLISLVAIRKNEILEKFSTFRRLQRVIAYIRRFIHNCKKGNERRQGSLQLEELQEAETLIIKLVQNEAYSEEIKGLKAEKRIERNGKLIALNPILDNEGILRIGGRIQKSDLSYEEKHPMIIPGSHKIAELLIKREHHKQLHAGAQTILYSLRQKFWIIGGLTLIKKILRKCITCFRTRPIFYKHQMGELPAHRVNNAKPFENCGLDYAGPVNIKASNLKNSKILKAYISIFICFTTKAVHIELVSDLTTEAFLNTLKRFIARRGRPRNIYSDNGRNFVGAYNQLKAMERSLMAQEYLVEETIKWHFIPPRSPHFGGLWEAAVRSAKTHLKKVIGETVLTFEELYTVLTQIEACLNSRPISPISDDPNDINPLTPAHFLLTKPIIPLPEENITNIPQNRLKRYQHLMFMVQHFWARWSKEYLNNLQFRSKWKSTETQPKEGDLVLLSDESTPPLHWRLGRIIKLHPGTDGVPRVAEVKTCTGNATRAIRKLCPLPV